MTQLPGGNLDDGAPRHDVPSAYVTRLQPRFCRRAAPQSCRAATVIRTAATLIPRGYHRTMHPPHISLEDAQRSTDFVCLRDMPGIAIDLRYASANNFVGRDVYSPMDCAWLHRDAADGLRAAQAHLKTQQPDWRFVVFDALRPHRIQIALWDALAGTGLQMYLAPPERGSIHSYGMALDVGLLNAKGQEVDMGTGFDALTPLSHPEFEAQHLAAGLLSQQQVANRLLLRDCMLRGNFSGIATEWWHFDCGDKATVRDTHARVA
jgi:zinc D-Ala-D-Ala dipeptidase